MAMVKALDDAVTTVEQALHDSGRHEHTVRVVTTDNGGCFWSYGNNYPLRGNKLSLWDGGMRGLAFVSSPLLNRGASGGQWSAASSSIQNSTILMHACDWCAMPALCLLACIIIQPHQPQYTSYVRVIPRMVVGLPPSSISWGFRRAPSRPRPLTL